MSGMLARTPTRNLSILSSCVHKAPMAGEGDVYRFNHRLTPDCCDDKHLQSWRLLNDREFVIRTLYRDSYWPLYSVSQKKSPLRGPDIFFHFFTNGWEFVNDFFKHLLNVPIFARLQIFVQLSPILTKLCHIKRDYPVHIICAKCPKRAKKRPFRRLRKSLIALLIVVCGKSL